MSSEHTIEIEKMGSVFSERKFVLAFNEVYLIRFRNRRVHRKRLRINQASYPDQPLREDQKL